MLDFLMIATRPGKKGIVECYPKFIIKKSSDLMIRGGDFYAIWVEERGLWSTDEDDVIQLIDREIRNYVREHRDEVEGHLKALYMWDNGSGMIDAWHKYCQRQMRDNYQPLDENLIFSNHETKKEDYASKKLSYPLEQGDITAYDKMMSILYADEERHKLEWAIGAIVSGESKNIQKFEVLYGAPGTGKGTFINIIQKLFDGYWSVFDARALGSPNSTFAMESFKKNPLVAIQHDGDLSRIEDNTRLNSIVSHEVMEMNEKFKASYPAKINSFLFMGTNKPVKITDAKSGLIRRLIDVSPTGNKIAPHEYKKLMKQVDFELGAIAYYCQDLYLSNPGAYDEYIPINMLGASNDFYNFVEDSYLVFKRQNGTTLKAAWEMYKVYCSEANVPYPLSQRVFREELKNYFEDCLDRYTLEDGTRVRSYYIGFLSNKFESRIKENTEEETDEKPVTLIEFNSTESILDKECADCYAQYANEKETPYMKWDDVKTKLSDLDTTKLHYVKIPENHIVIDFDIPDENGNKCFEKNLEAASHWPPTYAELSKSGAGIHLHYIYSGDATKLSRIYDEHIEVKVFNGKSSLRRRLSKCNNLPIATISSGLALKGEKMINEEVIKNEKGLRTLIRRNLNKEYHPGTKPSIDFIYKILEDAYNGGVHYDVTDMRNAVLIFATNSTHQADYCIKLVNKMKFKSLETSEAVVNDDSPIIFYDVEVFPNLFLVNWKIAGEGTNVVRLINPTPAHIEELMKYRLVGFNCRRYDNHMLYACLQGYTTEQIYKLSKKIIEEGTGFFGEAYNISYMDVFETAAKKQSLKKWEIELGIHHQELGLPWDKPVPKELWNKVAEYCDNDVIATEAVYNHTEGDRSAKEILAELTGGTLNDTTNSLTTKLVFGNDRKPQSQFNYRNMGEINPKEKYFDIHGNPIDMLDMYDLNKDDIYETYEIFNSKGQPIFPGYTYEFGKSSYRGEDPKEGGYVYAEPGIHYNVALLDVASMHPHSIIAEDLFGPVYTLIFKELVDGRIMIKHEDWEKVKVIFSGKFEPYVQKIKDGVILSKNLAQALKIAINSVYGLTMANFDNPFRDIRNKDNIVAKRGALFMINLKHQVKAKGFTVAHIKTDSIKVPDATPEIIEFITWYGSKYGYTFEHEATYEKLCLVNDAVYVCKDTNGEWSATGTQFQVPYVFKKLFSREPIEFDDMCETKSVSKGELYLDMNEKNEEEHNYIFVGRVGRFCPIMPGKGGGVLYRVNEDKYYAATGTKGYRWLESEMVKTLHKENDIDRSYYDKLVDEAVATIGQYGDVEAFIS